MFPQRNAIIRLLSDDDAQTVELVKNQLAANGTDSIPHLQDLLLVDDARVAQHVREVLGQIDSRQAREEFSLLCPDFPDDGDLENAAFLLARAIFPGVDATGSRAKLDQWGAALAGRLANAGPHASAAERVRLVADLLGRELGFHGNADDYYNVKNSLLPFVIGSRLGIPITLALVYMFTAKRAGMQIDGVSFPGHFLMRHEDLLFDPFERGRVLAMEDCAAILMRQNLTVDPAHFETAPDRVILRRMLANLLYLYQTEDPEISETLASWIHALDRPAVA